MTDARPERSDQLPEEGPAEQVPDDGGNAEGAEGGEGQTASGTGGRGTGGADDVDRQATGNPDNAG